MIAVLSPLVVTFDCESSNLALHCTVCKAHSVMILSSDRSINGARDVDMIYFDDVYCSTILLAIHVCNRILCKSLPLLTVRESV